MGEHESGDAYFSESRRYRYALSRIWDERKRPLLFIGLNPSTADEQTLDPTLRRVIGFAKSHDFGGVWMGNLFALRSTQPGALRMTDEPVGPDNDKWLMDMHRWCGRICCGWGTHGSLMNREMQVRRLFRGIELYCLGVTQQGHPKHPLYLRGESRMVSYQSMLWRPGE